MLATGGNETAARYAGVHVGRVKAFVYVAGGGLAALAGVVLAVVQGQGKADLATGYELDIIAAAVVGGASLSGGRASVVGAVIGALIFGVLRNALAQIPGGTFADRLILGVAVLGHRRDGPCCQRRAGAGVKELTAEARRRGARRKTFEQCHQQWV